MGVFSRKGVLLPLNVFVHAGALYQVRNRGLFIAITSKKTVHKLKNVEVESH